MQTKRAECEAVTKQKEADAKARAKESESKARIVESNNTATVRVKESADQVRIAEATAEANVQYYKMIKGVTDLCAKCNSEDERQQLMEILQKLSNDPGHQKRKQRKPRPRQGFNQARQSL